MKAPPYQPRVPAGWWLANANYFRYMMRELTCVFVGAYAAIAVVGLLRLQQGPEAWAGFIAALGSGPGLAFQLIALPFVLYHTISWFVLAPSSMPSRIGERQIPGVAITGAHYLLFALITVFILWLGGA